MQNWIARSFHPLAYFLKTKHNNQSPATRMFFLCLTLLFTCSAPTLLHAEQGIAPYKAVYTSSIVGIDADMEQTLTQTRNKQWQLHNSMSIMFVGFDEKSNFTIDKKNNRVIPLSYLYDNQFSNSRNSKLRFNPSTNSVIDTLHSREAFTLPHRALDKLSFHIQLRKDLIKQSGDFVEKRYYLVDRTRTKTYHVKKLGEEIINTPMGTFTAVKLEQRRPGKDKYTIVWLAKELDYFVLRIERFEDGESDFRVDLKSLKLGPLKV